MFEKTILDEKDQKIIELSNHLKMFQAFIISYMIANDLKRIETFANKNFNAADKVTLSLKHEEIKNERGLVAELFIEQTKAH